MASYTERERKLALITACVLGGAIVWLTGLGPALSRYGELSSELENARDGVARVERSNRRDRPYKHELRDLQKQLGQVDAAAFWARLEADILSSGVRMTSYTRGNDERKPKAGFAVVRYQLNLECDRAALQRLMLKFLKAEGFLRAHNISVSTKRGGTLTASMSVSTLVPLEKK